MSTRCRRTPPAGAPGGSRGAHACGSRPRANLVCWRGRAVVALTIAFAASTVALAEPATYRVDPDRTSATFAVTELGFSTQRGRFDRVVGTIVLDRQRMSGSVDLVVAAASVNTGWALRDAFLRGQNMFDVEHHPALGFRATRLVFADALLVAVDGEVTMLGVTGPMRLEVNHFECGFLHADRREGCDASVSGRLSRRAFGMGFAYPLIGDVVTIEFAITAIRDGGDGEDAR